MKTQIFLSNYSYYPLIGIFRMPISTSKDSQPSVSTCPAFIVQPLPIKRIQIKKLHTRMKVVQMPVNTPVSWLWVSAPAFCWSRLWEQWRWLPPCPGSICFEFPALTLASIIVGIWGEPINRRQQMKLFACHIACDWSVSSKGKKN